MALEIIARSAASHSNHFNQIEFLHSTGFWHASLPQITIALAKAMSLRAT